MWLFVLYAVYKLARGRPEGVVDEDEVKRTVYYDLWRGYGIALYRSPRDVERALRELEELGFIIRKDHKIRINESKIGEIENLLRTYIEELPEYSLGKYIKEKLDIIISSKQRTTP